MYNEHNTHINITNPADCVNSVKLTPTSMSTHNYSYQKPEQNNVMCWY